MHSTIAQRNNVRTVFVNTRALFLIQVANQLLPFILIPYLARILGVEIYGVVSFALALLAIALVITDYGFNLSATLRVSKHRDNVIYVNRLIGAVFLSKTVILSVVLPLIVVYALWSDKYSPYSTFIIFLSLPLVAQTFQPIWFFQGIEKMTYIATFTLVSRILYVVLIFSLVHTAADYMWIAIASGMSQTLGLILAIVLLIRLGYRPSWPSFKYARHIARNSTQFFWSRAAVSTYTAGGAIFLGLFSTSSQVAYYSAAEQLYKGGQALFAPLAQALYPNMVRTHNYQLLFKVVKGATLICTLGILCGVVLGPQIINVIFGENYNQSYSVLLVFLATLLINTPSVLIGYPLLGALGQASAANISVLIAGAIQLVLLCTCLLFGWKNAFEIALTVLAVETLVLILRSTWASKYYGARKKKAF